MFELLFKYSRLVFQEGRFAFASSWPLWLLALVGAAIAVPTVLSYTRARGKSTAVDRWFLGGVRMAAFALIMFSLFRPVLVLSTVVPQQNFLGILIDDSRSMEIADREGETRSDFVAEAFGDPESPLLQELADRFVLRFFRFSDEAGRLQSVGDLSYDGTRTRVGPALDRAREELSAVPLSGLVLVSDGADNSDAADLSEALLPLQASGVPVYAVGVGRERLSRDIQLSRIEAPRQVLLGASVVLDVVVSQTGYSGRTVPLHVEDQGRIVSTQDVELPGGGEPATVRVRFTANQPGPRIFRFRIPAQDGEQVTQNNVREVLVEVEDRREKILYFEGEPRYEVGFLGRAVEEDENLQTVVLQRTAENKFLRMRVDDAEELGGGFPKTREELFQYRALILGSVEAGHFTPDQLKMIEDFVSQRGGGLLMLGGRRSFAAGGYMGTPVADALPVILEGTEAGSTDEDPSEARGGLDGIISALTDNRSSSRPTTTYFDSVQVSPTRSGRTHPVTQIADTEEASEELWDELPPLTVVNPVRELKPGATPLLVGDAFNSDDEQIVLAFQRYGRGKSLVFSVQDSWLWQMLMPLDDMTHENFWRQLLRWLVDGVPQQVEGSVADERVEPGRRTTLVAEVDDPTYLDVNDGDVMARVTRPDGSTSEVPLDWTVEQDGRYEAGYTTGEQGLYEIEVVASVDGEVLGTDMAYVLAAPSVEEYFDPGMREPLLRRVARETGGQFYTPSTVSSLPQDISYTGGGVTVTEQLDLWDMPAILLLLIALVGSEWAYRRFRGLA